MDEAQKKDEKFYWYPLQIVATITYISSMILNKLYMLLQVLQASNWD